MTLEEELIKWLKERNASVTVAVRTPQGEYIKPENFIPAGWVVVWGIENVYAQGEKIQHSTGNNNESSAMVA